MCNKLSDLLFLKKVNQIKRTVLEKAYFYRLVISYKFCLSGQKPGRMEIDQKWKWDFGIYQKT